MTQQKFRGRAKTLPEVSVVFGMAAVAAYRDGERDPRMLNKVGSVRHYTFDTIEELNAFILGVEEATGRLDSLFIGEDN